MVASGTTTRAQPQLPHRPRGTRRLLHPYSAYETAAQLPHPHGARCWTGSVFTYYMSGAVCGTANSLCMVAFLWRSPFGAQVFLCKIGKKRLDELRRRLVFQHVVVVRPRSCFERTSRCHCRLEMHCRGQIKCGRVFHKFVQT